MQEFIGIKIITATPMTRLCYNNVRGWELPSNENGEDEGYLVIYPDQDDNITFTKGYVSWSPKEVFDNHYRPTTNLPYSCALHAMKQGHKVTRSGWNGKGIFVYIQSPNKNSELTADYIAIDTTGLQTDNEDAPKVIIPWLCSQTDALANDWCIVD